MIPILFESTETEFTSNGLGALVEATACTATEERNGTYEIELTYPTSGEMFGEITEDRYILAKPNDLAEPQPFRIYKITPESSGTVTVNAEHISYLLNGIPVAPFSATGIAQALDGIKDNSLTDNPFTFRTDLANTSTAFSLDVPRAARACLGGVDGSILDTFGGSAGLEYEFDLWTVYAHLHRGTDRGVVIEYGKNLTDLKQERSIESTYTGVLAYWQKTASEDEEAVTVTGDIQYIEGHENYPRERIYILDCSSEYQEKPAVSDLDDRAAKYIEDNNIGVPKVTLTVSFVALWQTEEYKDIAALERVSLCDTVTVRFPKLGVDAQAKVVKTTYDTIRERYKEIEIGDAKSSFGDTIKQTVSESVVQPAVKAAKSYLSAAIERATALITGNAGGYVMMHDTDGDDIFDELLIMDTDSTDTATKVWRWNKSGLGYSSTGYAGPYGLAMTSDGEIVADYITTGTLSADRIKGGTITASAITSTGTDSQGNERSISLDGGYLDSIGLIEAASSSETGGYGHVALTSGALHVFASETEDGTKTPAAYIGVGYPGYPKMSLYDISTGDGVNACAEVGEDLYGGYLKLGDAAGNVKASIGSDGSGTWVVAAGQKNNIVETSDYGTRMLTAYESPRPLYGDYGEGVIGADGKARIALDPIFAECAGQIEAVFVQGVGGSVTLDAVDGVSFTASGDPGRRFYWNIVTRQKTGDRLPVYGSETAGRTDYGLAAQRMLEKIKEEREL